ncbi:hypothetical protein GCM10010967_54970 [Dyadobacter beijingensis]|uniref:YD repeat-containing protein n=1 Tax=Dyadobacter beijingensis TaxID=365489 RepID=A0ABQ2IJ75_9BACT|nr:hypothetical protein [Dyadobacter beijingensis]GGN12017.1 hypothetical protein GCM10010967_54970 [Dyadobacter beijingensis]
MYRYETYAYDVQGDVIAMVAYEREAKSERFLVVADYAYFYDKLINPFYGHPGIFDFMLYFGSATANNPAVFSKHNIIRRVSKGFGVDANYSYTDTKYPLIATSIPWEDTYLDALWFEYLNCR